MASRTTDKEKTDSALREQLVYLLGGGGAHVSVDAALEGIATGVRGRAPKGLPYSPWQLLEHMRIAQSDILEFTRDRAHVSPHWPDGYWPKTSAPPSDAAWRRAVGAFRRDVAAMKAIVLDPTTNLFARIPWGDGQTILREALLAADHNAYHVGQMVAVRRLLGAWRE
jgi:hypothetical protein